MKPDNWYRDIALEGFGDVLECLFLII